MNLRKFKQADYPRVNEILVGYGLPMVDDDALKQGDFWVAENSGRVVGVGGVEYQKHVGLVRSLAVDLSLKGNGMGAKLYQAIENDSRQRGVLRLYLLTTTASSFFEKLGYEAVGRDLAPLPLQQSAQFSSQCPKSAVFMQKSFHSVQARKEFDEGLCCAESVLSVVAKYFGYESDLIPGIATGLCGGMGRTCGTCGAVTGAVLAVNLMLGRKSAEDSAEANYSVVQKLVGDFAELYGTTNCFELLDCDLGTEKGQTEFKKQELHRRCREFAGLAADLAVKEVAAVRRLPPGE